MRRLLALSVLCLLPLAAAHGSPVVLDVEIQVIQDEASDASYVRDGYDLQGLYMREAHWRPIDSDALIFRIIASGGSMTPAAGSSAIEVDVTIDGSPSTYRFETSDDAEWTGDLEIVEQSNEAGDFGSTNANFQFLLPVNASAGTTVGGFAMRSYHNDQMIDAAPGGLWGPAGEISGSGSSSIHPDHTWEGPGGYTASNVSLEDSTAIRVHNEITVSGQHVSVVLGEAAGWDAHIHGGITADVPAGASHDFQLNVAHAGSGSLPVEVLTDVGGRETGYLSMQAGSLVWTNEPIMASAAEDPSDEEAPGLALPVLLLGVLVLARRR